MRKEAEEKVFNNWTVKELLGSGAFGRVYRIEREEFGTTYQAAMKKIVIPQTREEIDDAISEGMDEQSVTSYFKSFVEEIINEFKLMSQLKGHTNIVSYEDHLVIPHEDGIGWDILIRMELLKSLKTLTTERSLTEEEVIKLGIDICNALEVCGKMNIIHRDIKPENIFISNFGEFKLGDFGIARTAEKTRSNLSKKGTYTYMAPEVYKGEAYNATVDIYSLGIVMYRFMNYNRAPFLPAYPQPISFSDREASMTRRISEEPMPAPACGSKELKRIILKACAYQPSARYQSPAQLRGDLENLLRNGGSGGREKAAAETVPIIPAVPLEEETMTVSAMAETATVAAEAPEETVTISAWDDQRKAVQPEKPAPENEIHRWDDTAEEEDSTVSMFDTRPEDMKPAPIPQPEEPVTQPEVPVTQSEEPVIQPKKKKKGLFIGIGAAVVALVAGLGLVFALSYETAPYPDETEEEFIVENPADLVEIVPLSEEYLYGHYTVGELFFDDTAAKEFFDEVGTTEISGVSVSAVPWEIYCFPEGTLYRTEKLYDLLEETGGDSGYNTGYPYAASRTYLDSVGMDKEEVFEAIVSSCFGDEVTTDLPAFYEEYIKGKGDTAELTYLTEDMKDGSLIGYYQVKDSVMEFSYLEMDPEGELHMGRLNYDVVFQNEKLIISKDGITGKLQPYRLNSKSSDNRISGYISNLAKPYQDISYVDCNMLSVDKMEYIADPDKTFELFSAIVYFTDGSRTEHATGTLGQGNRIEIHWDKLKNRESVYEAKEETGSLTAYYLDCDFLGCILRVDGKDYFYQKTEKEYYAGLVGDSVIDAEVDTEVLEQMGMIKMEMLLAMQEAMQEEFAAAGYTAEDIISINEKTGKITLKDGVLFDGDSSELSEEGMEYLSIVFSVMNHVIMEEEYGDYIDTIIIEGHTDSTGNYEENQELSENRADAVDDYCYELYPDLGDYIDTVGYASDKLIYDENGNENREASRRVEIMIALDVDAFIDEMEE